MESDQRTERTSIPAEVLLLASVLVLPVLATTFTGGLWSINPLLTDCLSRLSWDLPFACLVLYFMWKSGKGWSSFGLGSNLTFLGLLTLVFTLVAGWLLSTWLVETVARAFGDLDAYKPIPDISLIPKRPADWLLLGPVLLVGAAAEELIFRGFLTVRIYDWLGRKWLAILIPSILFATCHIYQGWFSVAGVFAFGVATSAMLLEWKSLKAIILAHTISNVIIIALANPGR